MKIPYLIRKLSQEAKREGRVSPVGIFEAWLCGRSRVIGAIFDHALFASAFLLPAARPILMVINRVAVLVPGALGVWIGLRNHDKPGSIRRALRGGAFQHDGDVVVLPKEPVRGDVAIGAGSPWKPKLALSNGDVGRRQMQRLPRRCKVKSVTVTGKMERKKVPPKHRLIIRPAQRGLE